MSSGPSAILESPTLRMNSRISATHAICCKLHMQTSKGWSKNECTCFSMYLNDVAERTPINSRSISKPKLHSSSDWQEISKNADQALMKGSASHLAGRLQLIEHEYFAIFSLNESIEKRTKKKMEQNNFCRCFLLDETSFFHVLQNFLQFLCVETRLSSHISNPVSTVSSFLDQRINKKLFVT